MPPPATTTHDTAAMLDEPIGFALTDDGLAALSDADVLDDMLAAYDAMSPPRPHYQSWLEGGATALALARQRRAAD